MKTTLVVLALAAASQAVRVPLCSAICMTNGIAATGCSASDTACICTSEKFFPTVAECAEADCNADKSVIDTAEAFCANAGIHVEVKRWGGGGPGHGPPGHAFGPEGHEFGRGGRWRGGRWRQGGKGYKGGKWEGFQGWWGGGEEKGSPAPPVKGGSSDSTTGGSSGGPPSDWEDWSSGGGRPHWGDHGNPWEPPHEGGNPPHTPTSPDQHHPHPTGPWEPPTTVV
ncbi:hypothetical protein A1O3_06034 [Capronia epimyces CBS 606.96]|uniref:CFEM domain-containing protein n=1 Tax=Capronia epimyces CBS 606.96 TaxID=1182542 RepID=W9XZ18_9EURO|nr:uncharacterized protein A1O3_06034 [Capronia epimyces CBS 606.96]EXJ82221.1 hypothetical protein A1O3_06034 [Capronia epimyces CBS 606.96]